MEFLKEILLIALGAFIGDNFSFKLKDLLKRIKTIYAVLVSTAMLLSVVFTYAFLNENDKQTVRVAIVIAVVAYAIMKHIDNRKQAEISVE